MKRLGVLALLGVLSSVAASPVAAQTAPGGWAGWTSVGTLTNVCGGSSFTVCFSADVRFSGDVLGVYLTNNPLGDGQGVVTRVGVLNVEDDDGTVTSGGTGNGPTGDWNWDTDNGLGGAGLPQSIYAWNSPSTPEGSVHNGLHAGESGYFTFTFANAIDDGLLDHVGFGVHAQAFGTCSSKFGVWDIDYDGNVGTINRPGGGDSCGVSVPEPGPVGLIAMGLLGMVFIARRRGWEASQAA